MQQIHSTTERVASAYRHVSGPINRARGNRGDTLRDLIAIRLAEDGVPVKAIARAIGVPAYDVYPALEAAKREGLLLAIPAADWPPGSSRAERDPTVAPFRMSDLDDVAASLAVAFGLTHQEALFLGALYIRSSASKATLYGVVTNDPKVDPKLVDVLACRVRRKLGRDLPIRTIFGFGFGLEPRVRSAIAGRISALQAEAA